MNFNPCPRFVNKRKKMVESNKHKDHVRIAGTESNGNSNNKYY